jgi:hypothetical protein
MITEITKVTDSITRLKKRLVAINESILQCKKIMYLIKNNYELPWDVLPIEDETYKYYVNMLGLAGPNKIKNTHVDEAIEDSKRWINDFNTKHELAQAQALGGGSKSRRKPARKTRRGRGRKSKAKAKAKSKTHRRRRHSRVRKHKKYTSRRR